MTKNSQPIKTILYATDYSESSKRALQYAMLWHDKTNADLVFVHIEEIPTVLNSPIEPQTFEKVLNDVISTGKSRVKHFCNEQLDEDVCSDVQIEVKVEQVPAVGILEIAKEYKADLIVMGTKGDNKLRKLLLGSTSKNVIENADCPVLTIPSDAWLRPIYQIVYATDFEQEDIEAIRNLSEIAKLFDATITVVHIVTED